ncbi:hypothetical protein NNX28_10960 [Arthrobacter sp. zg-Y859]|uniref:Uncharacterized protein n=1 Tax=Arthrobacter jinronghuae TaxID=2964609 RepID=A0ABT1NRV8_9MICC|nr:hypothetical protein [Arthrobacter jinronghuae]MCQ1950450.1 hypothetical protein [Arthrobacter jinronghuae]UWX77423.1 hypothetical protein N2K98_10450 [Arthrobacter jinronghuae]
MASPPVSMVPITAPDPEEGLLVTQVLNPEGDRGARIVKGLKTDAEAISFRANCDRLGTVTVDVAKLGPTAFTCGETSAHVTVTVDARPAGGTIDVTVTGDEDLAWGVTITEAELPDSLRNYPSSVSSPSSAS